MITHISACEHSKYSQLFQYQQSNVKCLPCKTTYIFCVSDQFTSWFWFFIQKIS